MAKTNCFKIRTDSDLETKKIGEILADWFKKRGKPAVLILSGDLGAGKTVLTKGLAKGLGIKKTVLSPSFVLLRSYRGRAGWRLDHLDAYRLSDKDAKIFSPARLKQPFSITVVEWPEKIPGFLPRSSFRIKISHLSQNSRILELPLAVKTYVTRAFNRRQ